ncbi:MAG: hypothetical protein NPIRA05_13650 [Nitrospirales bacterium]|nr:MAG: hypothetical protein NPIRA05_13650 [Nitrospirales bacterium]
MVILLQIGDHVKIVFKLSNLLIFITGIGKRIAPILPTDLPFVVFIGLNTPAYFDVASAIIEITGVPAFKPI